MSKIHEGLSLLTNILQDKKATFSQISSSVIDLYTSLDKFCAVEDSNICPLLQEIRKIRYNKVRCGFIEKPVLLKQGKETYFANVATFLFLIDVVCNFKLNYKTWESRLLCTDCEKYEPFRDITSYSFGKSLICTPEVQVIKMPLSQIYANLECINVFAFKTHKEVEELQSFLEDVLARISLLFNLELSPDDVDMEEYMENVNDHEVAKPNFAAAADLRLLYDDLLQRIDCWKAFVGDIDDTYTYRGEYVDDRVKKLKTFIESKSIVAERDDFLETFTEYVLSNKVCTNVMREIYYRRYPESQFKDTRRIIKSFLGQDAVVNYTVGYKDVQSLFEENPSYLYEFGFIYFMNEVYEINIFERKNSDGYLKQNPLNSKEYSYYNKRSTPPRQSQSTGFLTACLMFIDNLSLVNINTDNTLSTQQSKKKIKFSLKCV